MPFETNLTCQKQLGLCKNHHSSRMKSDLHTLDLGLQHSGCFWKLLLSSLPILLFLARGCWLLCRRFSLFVEAEVTASRVGSTLCVRVAVTTAFRQPTNDKQRLEKVSSRLLAAPPAAAASLASTASTVKQWF
jgi:hypothetical protein